jgi:hypothetical protein
MSIFAAHKIDTAQLNLDKEGECQRCGAPFDATNGPGCISRREATMRVSSEWIIAAILGLTAGCTPGQGNQRFGAISEALGGPTGQCYPISDSSGATDQACLTSTVDHNNLHFKFGYFDPTGQGYWTFALVSWGLVGTGRTGQDSNESGGFDLNNVQPGTLWQFQDAFCFHNPIGQSVCTNWSPWVFAYAQSPGTSWIDSDSATSDQLNNAVETGWEILGDGSKRSLKTCAVSFQNGEHVGKFFGGNCFIGWGFKEQVLPHSMVLNTLDAGVGWTWTQGGAVPVGAVAAGWENGQSQFACRAWFSTASGYQPGKALADGCHYSWGGVEHIETGWYQVLTN